MLIQKRSINSDAINGFIQNPSISMEHKCWRRFMNERTINRAYIPTTHGIFSNFHFH
jgi:hypothetical protein